MDAESQVPEVHIQRATTAHHPTEVLIIGAGPTGLVLALWLARYGVSFRIIERHSGPGQASRAIAVQARTLEFYRQLGFAEEAIQRGIKIESLHLREANHEVAQFRLGDFGEGISPFPFVLSLPQDQHEQLLVEQLAAVGITVEWNTELVAFEDDGAQVRATLRKEGVEETCEAAYICGCDGAHSTVRHGLGIGFPGGTYDQRFYLADVRARGTALSDKDFNICLGDRWFCAILPVRNTGSNRLIGIVPEELADQESLTFEDIRPIIEEAVDLKVDAVNWFSTYRVHHRVAEHFRKGRAFIAGDAGHVHSPAGGQGMNTGIGDAVNLAWKLAAVLRGHIVPTQLDTYESERMAFARLLVSTTDRAFQTVVSRDWEGRLFRTVLAPHLAPMLLGFSGVRRAAFRLISQTRIHYRDSPLSEGITGELHGGDRLPWVAELDNFAPLRSLDWQIHVYGETGSELHQIEKATGIPLHIFPWHDAAHEAGFTRDAVYVIRPDGYIALAAASQHIGEVAAYLARQAIRPFLDPAKESSSSNE